MSISIETLALAKKFAKKYTDTAVAGAAGGINYKGAVDYYSNLPKSPKLNDAYTVKYRGTSGTVPDGTEYVWQKYDGTNQWIAFGADMSQYQEKLVSGTNIRTVNGINILGSGDAHIPTDTKFSSSWSTTGTTLAFCQAIEADTSVQSGTAFRGEVKFSDLPEILSNAEALVQVISGLGNKKAIHVDLYSGNTSPYHWTRIYYNNTISPWNSDIADVTYNGQSIKNNRGIVDVPIEAIAVNPITTAPTAPNTDGLKFVVLNAEPANRYEGYIYLITEE